MMNYTSISGLSDIRRFPRLGKIHLGTTGVSQNTGRTYPMALDHFLVHADETTSAQSAAAFQAVYPGEPKSLRVMFPGNDTSQIFPQALKSYTVSQGLYCIGDGVSAHRRDEDGKWAQRECPCDRLQDRQCRRVASLYVMLPDVAGGGVWQIDTGSWHSIVNVNSGLDFVRMVTGGRVAMIPLTLRLVSRGANVNGTASTIHVLDLLQEDMVLAQIIAAAERPFTAALGVPHYPAEAPDGFVPGVDVDPETGELLTPLQPAPPLAEAPPEPPQAPPPPPAQKATRDQKAAIRPLLDGIPPAAVRAWLRETHNATSATMTPEQADGLIEWLKARQPAGAPDTDPDGPGPWLVAPEAVVAEPPQQPTPQPTPQPSAPPEPPAPPPPTEEETLFEDTTQAGAPAPVGPSNASNAVMGRAIDLGFAVADVTIILGQPLGEWLDIPGNTVEKALAALARKGQQRTALKRRADYVSPPAPEFPGGNLPF